jgi:triphosphoribosyl-dephospho-CoA synthase
MNAVDRVALHAQLACIWEASARKPGNVHRFVDFDDTSYLDFVTSAAAIAPVLGAAQGRSVGGIILDAVERTQLVARANTNLGIVLLLAPLAKAFLTGTELRDVLAGLTVEDAVLAYRAIRLANPGGLGAAGEQDVHDEPTVTLRAAMALAADRDRIARQYVCDFADVLEVGVPALAEGVRWTGSLEEAILFAQLEWLARYPDSLIVRKCGAATARETSELAQEVKEGRRTLEELDRFLRADGHRRNPGTTADLIAASLFVALERGVLSPLGVPWATEGRGFV